MNTALQTFRNQLAANPDDAEALARLEAALIEAGDWDGLVALTAERAQARPSDEVRGRWLALVERLEQHAAALGDPVAESTLTLLVGQLFEERLGEIEQAMLRYQRAFKLDPQQTRALEAARSIYVRQENWKLVLQLYSLELQVTESEERQADLYFEMADACLRMGEPGDAALCVRAAIKLVPDHPRAGDFEQFISSVHDESRQRFEQLLAEADGTRDARKRVALQIEAVDVWIKECPDDGRIEQILQQALDTDPRNDHARILLEQFYEANARWQDLTAFLARRAEATASKQERTALYQRLARVARHERNDADEAARWYREVLKLDAVETEALNFCVDHYSDGESWLELVAVYEAALRTRGRGGNEAAMLVQIAMILWRKVQDLEAAENYFKRIKLNDPRNRLMLDFYAEYYEAKGDWKHLLATLASRQNIEEAIEARIQLGLRMAEVAERRLENPEKAIDIWKSILKLRPDHEVARESLRRLFFDTAKWNALLEFLKEDLNLTSEADVEARVGIYRRMIEIYRDQLNLEVMVVNTYNQILQIDPVNAEALDALQEKYEASARWNDLIGILRRRADATADENQHVELLREIARLWLEKFSNPNQAIDYLEAILAKRPRDESAIHQLVEIYRHRKDWRSLYGIYRRQLELLQGDARVERLTEMARIAAEKLDEKDEAIALWREVLERRADDARAWQALEALYRKTDRHEDLASLFDAQAQRAADDAERVSWLKKLGNLYAEALADEDRAAETWRAVLRLQPGDLHAENYLRELYLRRSDWSALEGLYGERGDWAGFVRLLGGAASNAADVATRVSLYQRQARICRVNLEDEAAAIECWERILGEDADNLDAARTLVPHYTRDERWDDLVRVLEVVLRNEPGDPVALMVELAAVHEQKRGDTSSAYRWLASALRTAPERADLLEEARRTAASSGQWAPLADLLGALAPTLSDAEAEVRVRRVLADACAKELGRYDEAAEHLERVRELAGDTDDVLMALLGLYEKLARWDDLLGIQNARLERAKKKDKPAILAAIGRLHETVRDDAAAAREAFEKLLDIDGESLDALHGLQRLAEASGDVDGLTGHLEAELSLTREPAAVAALLFRLGELAEVRGDDEAALDRYAGVLEQQPDHAMTVSALVRFLGGRLAPRAAKVLEPHMRAVENWSGLRRVLELQVDGSDDRALRAKLLREVAQLREARLGDAEGAFDSWRRLLAEDRGDGSVRAELERLAESIDSWYDLAKLYGRFALGGADVGHDMASAADYSRRLASLLEERLGRFAEARATLDALLEAQGDDLELLEAVDRLATRLEDWRGLVNVVERTLPLLDDVHARIARLFRIGDLWEEVLEAPEQAVSAYRRVLDEEPGSRKAVAALERIFRNVGRFGDLADLLLTRLDDAAGAERAELTFQLAQTLEVHLDRPAEALERYAEVLELDGEHAGTITAIEALLIGRDADTATDRDLRARASDILEPVFARRGDWAQSVHVAQIRLGDARSPAERMALHVRIAELQEREGGDARAAFASYGAAMGEQYGHPDTLAQLLRLAEQLNAWEALALVLRAGLEGDAGADLDPALRREMLGRVADLYETRVGNLDQAIAFNRRILDEDADDAQALASLDRLYERTGDVDALVEVIERRVAVTMEGREKAALLFRAGEIYESLIGDRERAIDAYRRVRLDVDPEDLRAHIALERLHEAAGQWEALVDVLLDHADRVENTRKELLFRAASVYEARLDRPDEAVSVLRRILDLDADDGEALARLDRLYTRLERPVDLLEILERERALAADDATRDELDFRMGTLLRAPLGETERAVERFRAVLRRTPRHPGARLALEGLFAAPEVRLTVAGILAPLYEADGEWRKLRDILRGTLDDLDAVEARVSTLRRIAQIEEERLGDAAAAFASLAEAYRYTEADVELEAQLERLADVLGAFAELAGLLEDMVPNAPERAVTLHLKVAAIAHGRLDDAPRAIAGYRRVLDLEADNARALDALEGLYEITDEPIELVEIIERKAALTEDVDERKLYLYRVAELQESMLRDPSAAVETLRRVIVEDDRDGHALDSLERLLASSERWPELAAMYEHRMGILEARAPRAEVEFRLAKLSAERLSDGQRALDIWRGILADLPDHGPTRGALEALFADPAGAERVGIDRLSVALLLEPIYREGGEHGALVSVLEARQEASREDPLDRVGLLREIAHLREHALGDVGGAFETCGRVLRLAPDHEANRADLHRLAGAGYTFDALAGLLEEVVADVVEPELKVDLLLELGRLQETHRGQDVRARDVYREVLDLQPGRKEAVDALVELYSRTAAWEDLVELYLRLADSSSDEEEQKALYFRVCQLLQDVVGDTERAIATYRRILEIEPENRQAFKALERFYTAGERWVDLADLLRDEIRHARTDLERADLRYRLGEVLEAKLDDAAEAVEVWNTVLHDDDTGHAGSLDALERILLEREDADPPDPLQQRVAQLLEPIYAGRGRWDDWVHVLEVQIRFQDDPWQRMETLTRIARAQEEHRADPAAAFSAYARAFAEDYGNPDLQAELDRLGATLEAWRPLVEAYLTGIETFDDLEAATAILLKVAATFDRKLGEADRAIDCYRRVLMIDEANAEALNALERILAAEGRHQDLVTVLSRKADFARDVVEKKELLFRICDIWEQVLDRPDQAIETYRRVLEEDAEDQAAIDALIRLYERTGDWELLVQVLREKLEMAADDDERKRILYRIARTCEEQLHDPAETILTYRSVLETDARDRGAIEALDRLYSREGRWGELIDLLETERGHVAEEQGTEARVDALDLRIADVLESQLGQHEQAIEIYGEILGRSGRADDARQALERLLGDEDHRLKASRVLEPYYRDRRQPEALARIYELQLLDIDDRAERLDLLKRLAKLRYGQLKHPRSAFETFGRAFREDPSDEEISQALHDLADELNAHAELAVLYAERIEHVLDREVVRTLTRRLARLYDDKLRDGTRAIETWRALRRDDAYDLEALQALDRLYQERQDWVALIEILRKEIELGGADPVVRDQRFRLGYLLEVVEDDVPGAIDLYRSILWEQPDHVYALEAMERLAVDLESRRVISEVLDPIYRDGEKWDKLAILTEMRIELTDDAHERARLWTEAAELREQKLNDADAALERLLWAFEESPSDADVRGKLVRVATERGAWRALADAFDAVQERIDDFELRIEDLLRIADWSRGRLRDAERAVARYRKVLEIDETNERALDALESLYEQGEQWADLADVHRRKAAMLFDLDEKKQRLLRLADLCAEKLGDVDGAVAAYEDVLQIDEADARALAALERLHERTGNWAALCGVLERKADATLDGGALAAIHRRTGELRRGRLADPEGAAQAFESVLDHEPEDVATMAALREIYFTMERWDRLRDVLLKELAVVSDDERRVELLFALGETADRRLDQPDNAIEYYRQVLTIREGDPRALEQLEALFERTERWFDLVETLREHLGTVEGAARLPLLVRVAGVAEGKLLDADLAIETLNEVLELDPNHAGALNVLARLYERNGEWERCAETLSRAIQHAAGGAERGEALRRLGLLYLERLDRPEEARASLEAAVGETGDEEALQALLKLARDRGDDAEVASLLEKRLATAEGAPRVALLREIAALRQRAGDVAGRVEALREAHALAPDDLAVADALLDAWFAAGRYDEAEPVLARIIERLKAERRLKELFTYNFRMGCVAEERGDVDAALASYTSCFEYDATYLPNLFRLGKLHFRREEWDKALKIFQAMLLHQMKIESNAQRVEIFYHLGVVRLRLGDDRKARDMFTRALGYDPEHALTKRALEELKN